MTIPDEAVFLCGSGISAAALASWRLRSERPSAVPPEMQREALVLAVMAEIAAGSDSRWGPYFVRAHAFDVSLQQCRLSDPREPQAALPPLKECGSPLGWTAAELRTLRGSSTLRLLRAPPAAVVELPCCEAELWVDLGRGFFRAHPGFHIPTGGAGAAAHARATALVAGWSFSLGDGKFQAMVPFWDMLNHASPRHASVATGHSEERGALTMTAVRSIAKGDEVSRLLHG